MDMDVGAEDSRSVIGILTQIGRMKVIAARLLVGVESSPGISASSDDVCAIIDLVRRLELEWRTYLELEGLARPLRDYLDQLGPRVDTFLTDLSNWLDDGRSDSPRPRVPSLPVPEQLNTPLEDATFLLELISEITARSEKIPT